MADGSKVPLFPSISPNFRPPQKDFVNLRQTVDIMLKQIHNNQEAIRARDDEIVALRMELFEVKKTANDKMYRMSNNIKSLKQQVNDLRQRESAIRELEQQLNLFTTKQEELMTFQEKQDNKLSEMECSIIESCHRAIADIRTKQMRETEETSQNQIQSMTKIISVQGILRSNVQSVQTLLEKKTNEDNRRFQKQETWVQTLQPKVDQVLGLENSINRMISWRKAKTEADKKVMEQLSSKIVHLQDVLTSTPKHSVTEGKDFKEDVPDIKQEQKTDEIDNTSLNNLLTDVTNLKSRIENAEVNIIDVSKWQRDQQMENDQRSHGSDHNTLQGLQERISNLENKADIVKKGHDNKVEVWTDGSDHGRMIAKLKRRADSQDEMLQILEERVALRTSNVFQVSLNASQSLQAGKRVKLDRCVKVWFDNNGLFDKDSCCLVPQNNCRMALAWRLVQYGEGEMEVWMGVDGVEEGDYLGKTTRENEVMSGMLMWGVRKGQRVWMEVERGVGEAGLWNCLFMAWVVG